MTATLRKNIQRYDQAVRDAQRRIDSQWLDRRIASLTPIADDRDAQYAAARQTLAAQHGIPANLA